MSRQTEHERRLRPSRRTIIGVAACAPLLPWLADQERDLAAGACAQWLAQNAEHDRVVAQWQALESQAFKTLNWAQLTRAQRSRLAVTRELEALADRLDMLHAANAALFATLPALGATSRQGVDAKLRVAVACVEANMHDLVASILRDYRALYGARRLCWALLTAGEGCGAQSACCCRRSGTMALKTCSTTDTPGLEGRIPERSLSSANVVSREQLQAVCTR